MDFGFQVVKRLGIVSQPGTFLQIDKEEEI